MSLSKKVKMKIEVFSGLNLKSKLIHLSSYRGKKVLISFFRDTSCPFCNMRLRELILNYEELQKQNIDVIVLFPSSIERINEFSGGQNPPFEIIADPDEKIYKQIGVRRDKLGMLKTMFRFRKMFAVMKSGFMNTTSMKQAPILPIDILIDENQDIIYKYEGKDFGDHLPLSELKNK